MTVRKLLPAALLTAALLTPPAVIGVAGGAHHDSLRALKMAPASQYALKMAPANQYALKMAPASQVARQTLVAEFPGSRVKTGQVSS